MIPDMTASPDPETLRLINAEISARAGRLDTSTSRLDTKATTLLGFVLAAVTFLAAQKTGGWWKVPPLVAYGIAAYFGQQAMRPRSFKDAPEPQILVEHVAARGEAAALLLLIHAKVRAFAENRITHEQKARSWRLSEMALILAVALTDVALIFGGTDGGRDGQQRSRPVPSPSASP